MESSETRKKTERKKKYKIFLLHQITVTQKPHSYREDHYVVGRGGSSSGSTSDFGSRGPGFDSHREPRHCSSIGSNKVAVWCDSTDVVRITPQPKVTGRQ